MFAIQSKNYFLALTVWINQFRLCIIRLSWLFNKTKQLVLIKSTERNINNIHIKYSVTYFLFCVKTFLSVSEGILRCQTKKWLHWQDKWWYFFSLHLHFFTTQYLYKTISDISSILRSLLILIFHLSHVWINLSHKTLIHKTVSHLWKFDQLDAFQNKSFTFLT